MIFYPQHSKEGAGIDPVMAEGRSRLTVAAAAMRRKTHRHQAKVRCPTAANELLVSKDLRSAAIGDPRSRSLPAQPRPGLQPWHRHAPYRLGGAHSRTNRSRGRA